MQSVSYWPKGPLLGSGWDRSDGKADALCECP